MDQISNMLITMKNGAMVGKRSVVVPFSALKLSIAECLKGAGYIANVSKKTEKDNRPVLAIDLAFIDGKPRLNDVERVSKQSRRVYMGVKDIRPIKNGHGMTVFSTPKGILSDKDARKEQVGGEALFKIW